MAAKNNEVWDYPETITIIAEPGFGTALKLLLLGGAIGAGTVLYLLKSGTSAAPATAAAPAPPAPSGRKDLGDRVHTLASRLKVVAGRTRDVAQIAAKAVTPVIKNAIAEGKRVAHETAASIEEDLENDPDTKYAAEGEELEAERKAEAQRRGF